MMPPSPNRYQAKILSILVVFLVILPVSATTIAIYGDTAGFRPDAHPDEFTVAYALDGSFGSALDQDITRFTDPAVSVIFMGGDESFSTETATLIEEAARSGKVVVVTNKHYQKINASLPATNGGTVPEGRYLEVARPESSLAGKVFEGLRSQFPVTNPLSDRLNTIAKPGSVTLLQYDTGDPALLYWSYGSGYVVEWAMTSPHSYLNNTEADYINARLLRYLLAHPAPAGTTVSATITTPMVPATSAQVTATTSPSPEVPDPGTLMVYSSPTGANILLDGIYYGTTPGNLTGIAEGTHILRLTMSGYYDYEGTTYVLPGRPNHAFGTLQPISQISAAPPTAIPIIVPVVTPEATKTPVSSAPLENPGVVVAIIGVITASIAAATTIFTHVNKVKKELKDGKE